MVGLFDGTRLGGYGWTGVRGGVCLQSPQSPGSNSNGVIVPPHLSSKLQGEAVSTIGEVLAVLLDVRVGVGGQKYTSFPSIPKKVGEDGVRSPPCFLRAEGDKQALLGIGERTIGRAVFSCGIFNWEEDGLEKTIADE